MVLNQVNDSVALRSGILVVWKPIQCKCYKEM